jgi:hypothetical protein
MTQLLGVTDAPRGREGPRCRFEVHDQNPQFPLIITNVSHRSSNALDRLKSRAQTWPVSRADGNELVVRG